ncbi:MAG: N-acyl-D-amino-acid deacylase [Actinomycetota bacterium]|nr:N-acyl-D-amino-acid deacylase [Actinomycetota bacterium]
MPISLVIRGGTVYDGSGAPGRVADVAVDGDRVVGIEDVPDYVDAVSLDASGLAVVPGFINVLSHAWPALQKDGTGASDLLQGVTTEVFGEAFSPGPSGPGFEELCGSYYAPDVRVDFPRLSDGLDDLVRGGLAMNVASSLGGMNLRIIAAGFTDRRLTEGELDALCGLVAEEMQEGALGIGTALIYPPGRFADTDELVALCEVVARYDGVYTSHLRSEGDRFLECLDELVDISDRSSVRAEVFHLKAAGRANWPKMQLAIDRIAAARASGRPISANMYPYEAGGTALAASIPPRFHEGGPAALAARLSDPAERRQMAVEMSSPSDLFENLFLAAGGAAGILLLDDLADGTPCAGRRLSDVAADLDRDDNDALLELVRRDASVPAAYFLMDPAGVELGLRQPWVSIGSDAPAFAPTPPWTDGSTHPRTYGTFARVLGHFGRDRGLFTFEEAVRRMTSQPADVFRLTGRGRLGTGTFADVVLLDPATVADRATFEEPHQLAVGVHHVVVNGEVVVRDGSILSARPGRRLRRGQPG